MQSFKATPLELQISLIVAADCQVLDMPPDAAEQVRRHLTNRHRICRIGGTPTPDRSSLRDIIAQLPDDPVEVAYELVSEHQTRIDIATSVEHNGKVCNVADRGGKVAMQKMLDDEQESDGDSTPRRERDAFSGSGTDSGDEEIFQGKDAGPAGQSTNGNLQQLLSFATLDSHADFAAQSNADRLYESIQTRLQKAVTAVKTGHCIIAVCREVNPISEIELLAQLSKRKVFAVDCSLKVRNRPKPSQITQAFKEAMKTGAWFAVLHGNKSIGTLQLLEGLVREIRDHGLQDIHTDARIFVCLEQHPHFPRFLAQGAITLKFATSFSGSTLMSETMSSSSSCTRITGIPKQLPVDGPDGRRVRISAAVDIVDIEPREVYDKRSAARPIDVSGSVVLQHTFSGLISDKFLCVTVAGERGRYAVGSSLGNIYFLDSMGCNLLQTHAHDASVWDLAFKEKYAFATASEDGTAREWDIVSEDTKTLRSTFTGSLGSDVYCVKYLNENDPSSPLISGGLANNLLVKSAAGVVQYIRTQCSVQVVKSIPNEPVVIVGGGDGTISLIDVNSGNQLSVLSDHTRKIPTLCVRDEHQFFSGSFDSTIRAWDCRARSAQSTLTLKLKNYVTGIDVDGNHLAASVGENLYLWDVRKLGEVLGGFPQGWKGLSRGILVQSEFNTVITASPDGYVRFWRYV